jgi:4-hydroxyacetophenone monooxygenase
VDLVTVGIDRIVPEGIVDREGNLHPVDVIVYGTGFKASDFLFPMTVIGRDGMDLHDEWGGDVQAYYGVNIPKFPNLFLLYGPNTNLVVNGSLIFLQEMGVEFILSQIKLILATDSSSIEIKDEPFEHYNRWLDEGNARMSWSDTKASSWYRSATSGRSSQNWPFSMLDYWKGTHAWDASLFNLK